MRLVAGDALCPEGRRRKGFGGWEDWGVAFWEGGRGRGRRGGDSAIGRKWEVMSWCFFGEVVLGVGESADFLWSL